MVSDDGAISYYEMGDGALLEDDDNNIKRDLKRLLFDGC
jgi:hypothetical protein